MQFCLSEDIEYEHIDPLTLDDESQEFYGYASRQIGEFVAAPSKTVRDRSVNNGCEVDVFPEDENVHKEPIRRQG